MFSQLTDLDLRLIRVFLAIVDAGGVSPAQATLNVGQPTISSRVGWSIAQAMASAATSGSKIGGTGCGLRGSRLFTQPNCGVFTAGISTMET